MFVFISIASPFSFQAGFFFVYCEFYERPVFLRQVLRTAGFMYARFYALQVLCAAAFTVQPVLLPILQECTVSFAAQPAGMRSRFSYAASLTARLAKIYSHIYYATSCSKLRAIKSCPM
jgi:hypothetical protein